MKIKVTFNVGGSSETREIEAGVIILFGSQAKALENEAHDPDSLQQRLKDFGDEETVPAVQIRNRSNQLMYLKIAIAADIEAIFSQVVVPKENQS